MRKEITIIEIDYQPDITKCVDITQHCQLTKRPQGP